MKDKTIWYKFIWDEFELFIRRAILPSSTLLIIYAIVGAVFYEQNYMYDFYETYKSSSWIIILVVCVLILGLNYILKIASQLVFDNWIKSNYNSFIYRKETKSLTFLRNKVIEKLTENSSEHEEYTDFMLYQYTAKITEYDTKRYSTDSKEASIMFMSLMFIGVVGFYLSGLGTGYKVLSIILFLGITWFIGYEYMKSKFRSRAFRLYVNYLLLEDKSSNLNTDNQID